MMTMEERVEKFGNTKLHQFYNSMDQEQFSQEHECGYLDSSSSYFPIELLQKACSASVELYEHWSDLPRPKGEYVAGVDLGRHKDRSELTVFDSYESGGVRHLTCVYVRSWSEIPLRDQEAEMRDLIRHVPFRRFAIDGTGLGVTLAENLAMDFRCVCVEKFSMESKERWLNYFKILLQNRQVHLPAHSKMIRQLHSIKRNISKAGNILYTVDSRTDHADLAWAVVLGCYSKELEFEIPEVTLRIVGEDW
jgi:phage FluMu gp28-like protein